jgi:hypothetical protein
VNKPILCLDFDGVIHSYESGWVEADFIPDPPVPGAIDFLWTALDYFDVKIHSSRSHHDGGIRAMRVWLEYWVTKHYARREDANKIINAICWNGDAWPTDKPPAAVTLDDRAITFTGTWPAIRDLQAFTPWNKRPKQEKANGAENSERAAAEPGEQGPQEPVPSDAASA